MKNKTGAQEKIAFLIKTLRERKGMTQGQFAKALATSQSAVARMERGLQNFTLGQLEKVSDVFKQSVVNLGTSTDDFEIKGGRKLHGTITTNTSKNGALGLMCAALVNRAPTILHGIPRIEELNRMIEVFESIGVRVDWTGEHSVRITSPKIFKTESLNTFSAMRIRSVLMLMGGLIHHKKNFSIPHAGGCNMGERTINAHEYGLQKLGVHFKKTDTEYQIRVPKKLRGGEVTLYESSDTAAENILIACALIPQKTVIYFAPPNYQVQEVCYFLQKLGVNIEGIGTTTLTVHGLKAINKPIEYTNSEDPIESMTFISAAIMTESKLTIARAPIDFLRLEIEKLSHMGMKYKMTASYLSKNNRTRLADITVYPSKLKALSDKIHAQPYPGINADNLPFFVPLAAIADGATLVHDWMWENRAIYFTELSRLGADITLADPHRVIVRGVKNLKSGQIVCPPALRPSMIILVAMLGAKGTSILRNVYAINRGYERIIERLNSVGANIRLIRSI